MMRVLDAATICELIGRPDLADAVRAQPEALCDPIREWAERIYPDASNLDRCSFAGLLAYLATGWYGGYGTESYERERQVEDLLMALAGGWPAPPGEIVSLTPILDRETGEPVLPLPPAEFTRVAWEIACLAYFHADPRAALDAAARVVATLPGGPESPAGHAREGMMRVLEKYFGEETT